jgi:hypothetical protein
MIKLRYAFLLFLFSLSLFAQEQKEIKPADSLPHWTKTNKLGFDISQIAFVNWSAQRRFFESVCQRKSKMG